MYGYGEKALSRCSAMVVFRDQIRGGSAFQRKRCGQRIQTVCEIVECSKVNTFAPGIGSLVGAGAGLLGDLFGQADDNTSVTSGASDLSTTSANRPSATITKSGPETIINNNYLTNNIGNFMGDEQSRRDLSEQIFSDISSMKGAMA